MGLYGTFSYVQVEYIIIKSPWTLSVEVIFLKTFRVFGSKLRDGMFYRYVQVEFKSRWTLSVEVIFLKTFGVGLFWVETSR